MGVLRVVARYALVDEPLIQVSLFGNGVGGEVLDILGGSLVADDLFDALDNLILNSKDRKIIRINHKIVVGKKQSDQSVSMAKTTYIEVFHLLVLLLLIEVLDLLSLLFDALLEHFKILIVLVCDLPESSLVDSTSICHASLPLPLFMVKS